MHLHIATEFCQGWRNRDKGGKDRRAGFLAHAASPGDIFDNAPTHAAVTPCANLRGHPWTLNGFRARTAIHLPSGHAEERNASGQYANLGGTVELDRHQVCNHSEPICPDAQFRRCKKRYVARCGGSEPDLVVTASDQRPDTVAAVTMAVTMRVWAVAPHHLHHWVRFRRRKRIGADRWQSGRRGHTDRANEDRRKNVAHLVTPFGPIRPWALRPTRCLAQFAPA